MKLKKQGVIAEVPLTDYVAAISVGAFRGDLMIDLNYAEDSSADMDMNVVMVGKGKFVEVQGTAEGRPFSKTDLDKLLDLAKKGIKELIAIQKKNLGELEIG
jgi:ribonuclease PH